MTADSGSRTRPLDADGFTLVEVVIVTMILALVAVAVASAFVVVVRTSPLSEARADDSRSLLNLTNWISQDVASTAEDGFSVGNNPTGCDSDSVPASTGLMQLAWSEGSHSYTVNYRYVPVSATSGSIYRFACLTGQQAESLKLTPELRNRATGALAPAPVAITLVPNPGGNPGHKGLQFVVTVVDADGSQRELLSLDATTTNVRTTLPPLGGTSGTNTAPVATPGATTVVLGESIVYSLVPGIASDPNGDTLTATVTGYPAAWTVSVVGTDITIEPVGSEPGEYVLSYTVTDPGSLSASSHLTVTVLATAPNLPPQAFPVAVNATRGVPLTLVLDAIDPEGGPLVASLSGVPSGWSASVDGLNATIMPSATATGTTSITYTVTDDVGQATSSTITVSVCTVSISQISPNSVKVFTSGGNTGNLQHDVDVRVTSNGACTGALVLAFKPKASDAGETTINFNASNAVMIDRRDFVWDLNPQTVTLRVRQGANGAIEATGTLQITT